MEIIQTKNENKDTGKKGNNWKKRVLGVNNKQKGYGYKKNNSFHRNKNIQRQEKENDNDKENETFDNKPFKGDQKRNGVKEDCKLLIHLVPSETKIEEIPKLFTEWLPDFNADDVTNVEIWYTKKPPLGHQAKGVAVVVVKSNEQRDALVNYYAQHSPLYFTNERGISSKIHLNFAYPLDEKEKEKKNERFQYRNKSNSLEDKPTSSNSSSEAKENKKVCLETLSVSENNDSPKSSTDEKEEILSCIKICENLLKQRCPGLFESELEMKALNETEINLQIKIKNQESKIKEAKTELKITREQFEQYEFLTV